MGQDVRISQWLCLMVLAFTLPLVGCGGSDGPTRAVVRGTVTFDGTPIESGYIEFIPVQGVQAAPVKLTITDGKYDSSADPVDDRGAPLGKANVVVTAFKESDKRVKNPDGEMEGEIIQYIPPQFNAATTLTTEITPDVGELNFQLVP